MSLTEKILLITTIVGVFTAVAAVIRDWRKPQLDAAQAEHALVNSDSVKAQIKKMSDESNIRRDLRILDLESWADEMRPWASDVQEKHALLTDIVRSELWTRGKKLPDDLRISPPPKFPPPRTL